MRRFAIAVLCLAVVGTSGYWLTIKHNANADGASHLPPRQQSAKVVDVEMNDGLVVTPTDNPYMVIVKKK